MRLDDERKIFTQTYQIGGMDCSSCADEIRKALLKIEGISNAIVDVDESKISIKYFEKENSLDEIEKKISELGFQIQHEGSRITTVLKVSGMDCAIEENTIREGFKNFPGIESLRFDLINHKLIISHSATEGKLINRLKTLGFESEIYTNLSHVKNRYKGKRKLRIAYLISAGVLAFTGMILELFNVPFYFILPIFILSIIAGGWRVTTKAFYSILNLNIDINVLMTLAVIGACFLGEWAEASAVMFLFALSLQIENFSIEKAKSSIQNLLKIIPDVALIKSGNEFIEIFVSEIKLGDEVFIKAGERIPIDGIVLEGSSTVNQAPITGESNHLAKVKNDPVYAGTINIKSPLLIKATGSFKDSQFAKIISLLEEASSKTKSNLQRTVDKFAKYYTPVIVISAILTTFIPTLIFNKPFDFWFYNSLVLLVIGCPCALVISTPVCIVSGISRAAKLGAIIKGPVYLENFGSVDAIVFDKTGTLTEGTPKVEKIIPFNHLDEKEIISIAYAIEINSEHAIADAIVSYAEEKRIPLEKIEDFQILESGVSAQFKRKKFILGQPKLLKNLLSIELKEKISALEKEGYTVVILSEEESPCALICFSDSLRKNMKKTIDDFNNLGVKDLYILSGDNKQTVASTAKDLGIENYFWEQTPTQKLSTVEELNKKYKMLAMVGDGVNDAPALAASKIGIAMGKIGTDAAIETSNITLVGDDISKLPKILQLSRKAVKVIKENIFLAIGIKIIFITLTFIGIASMWSAIFADMGTSLIVVFNGLKILNTKL